MDRTDAVRRMAEDYLDAVAAAMAMRPEAERRDVLAQLAEQLDEAVGAARPADGESPEEVMERIIGEMDPPESFVVDEGDGGDAAAAVAMPAEARDGGRRRGPGGWWWFALAVMFFAVNVWGILRTGGSGGDGEEPVEVVEEVEDYRPAEPPPPPMPPERILRLRRVSVMEVSAERQATLLATFSAEPDRLQLTRTSR